MIAWWIPAALATPVFEGAPEDAERAAAWWDAEVACAGRSPEVPPRIPVVRDLPPGFAFDGITLFGEGRAEIHLRPRTGDLTLGHEVAHLFFHSGSDLVDEGRAEALMRCAAAKMPGERVVPHAIAGRVAALPDLRTWTYPRRVDEQDDAEVGAGYTGSRRLFVALAGYLPPGALWAPELDSWARLADLIRTNESIAWVADAFDGGAAAQAALLDDPDRDGLSTLDERLAGTDPEAWDSDRDGWWDGAAMQARTGRAMPFRPGDPYLCFPIFSAVDDFQVDVTTMTSDGTMNTMRYHMEKNTFGMRWEPPPGLDLVGGWADIAVGRTAPNPHCATSGWGLVRMLEDSDRLEAHHLRGLVEALASEVPAVRDRFGVPIDRVWIWIAGHTLSVSKPGVMTRRCVVTVTEEMVLRAAQVDNLRGVALAAAALSASCGMEGAFDTRAARAALLKELKLGPSAPGFSDVFKADLDPVRARVAACPDGWKGVLTGACTR